MYRRRNVLGGVAATISSLPLATVLADPRLARAAAERLERHTLTLSNGKIVQAFLGRPLKRRAPAVMLVHEWWGLNDQIKAVAAEFAEAGYLALAIDLMGGRTADHRNQAKLMLSRVSRSEALETAKRWLQWLKRQEGATGKVGVVGWCFGGGWALSASTVEPVDATVVYYGRVNHPTTELKRLRGPVLGHFATHDIWINRDMVTLFEVGMNKVGKPYTNHWYDARHAFANPTRARYDHGDAVLAWERTLAFFDRELR